MQDLFVKYFNILSSRVNETVMFINKIFFRREHFCKCALLKFHEFNQYLLNLNCSDSIAPKILLKYLLEHFTQSLLPANKGLIFQICIYRKVTIFSKVEVGSYSVGSYLFLPLAKKMLKYSLSKRQSKNRKYHRKLPLNVLLDRFLI